MGRRRRRVVRIVKKKLPTVFVCPRCGEEAVRVSIDKTTGKATVLCALCNLKNEFQAHPLAQPIDVYSYFTDVFYGVPNPRAIIPREREFPQTPTENIEGPEESTASQTITNENPETNAPSTIGRENEKEQALEDVSELPREEIVQSENAETLPEQAGSEREEAEPFADILNNTDKKRYSTRPVMNQQQQGKQEESQEQTSSTTQQQ